MAKTASSVVISESMDIHLSRSPISFYGIEEKHREKGCLIFCVNCNKPEVKRKTFKICLKCQQLNVQRYEPIFHHYCGVECQKEHWKIHKLEHIRYEKMRANQTTCTQEETEDRKDRLNVTLFDGHLKKVVGVESGTDASEPCEELEKFARRESDGEIVKTVLTFDRATSPIGENVGIPDKVQFNISAGTQNARFCLGQKITRSEGGGVETSTVALLKQETTPDGTLTATTTPVFEENVIYVKNAWKQQVPMAKHPSKNLQDRGRKKDAATSPPQKGDLSKSSKKSTRKGGRGSGKVFKKGEETVADISDRPPSKTSSEPFWKPNGESAGKKPLPPSTSVSMGDSSTKAPATVSLKSNMTGRLLSEPEEEPEKEPPKEVAKPKPKRKKKHNIKDVASLSNKHVTVVDVNECPPLEPKHFETDTSSSGEDAGGYMMYIITDEDDGTRSAVVQKRKDKRKSNFNPRILFEKEHMKKKRSVPRKDGKPRQEVTFHFSHPSDQEYEDEDENTVGSGGSSDLKAISNIIESKSQESASSQMEETSSKSSSSKDGKTSAETKGDDKGAVKTPVNKTDKVSQPTKRTVGKDKEEKVVGRSATPSTTAATASSVAATASSGAKPKFDPAAALQSVCKKINIAFGEEMPRPTRIVEVTVSDDETEQVVFKKSTDYVDKLLKRHEKKSWNTHNVENAEKKEEREASSKTTVTDVANTTTSPDTSSEIPQKTQSDDKPITNESSAEISTDAKQADVVAEVGPVESSLDRQNSNNSNGASVSATSQSPTTDEVSASVSVETKKLSKHDENSANKPESSKNSAEDTKSVKDEKNENKTKQEPKTREGNLQEPQAESLRSTTEQDKSRNKPINIRGGEPKAQNKENLRTDLAGCERKKTTAVSVDGKKTAVAKDPLEERNFVLKKKAFDGGDVEVKILRTRTAPVLDPTLDEHCALRYYVSRRFKIPSKNFLMGKKFIVPKPGSESLGEDVKQERTQADKTSNVPLVEYQMSSQTKSEPDLESTGKFRVLNSDKEFGDIYSDESIAQLSNPSVDVSKIFDTDSQKTGKSESAAHSDNAREKTEKPKSKTVTMKTTRAALLADSAPYITRLCTCPQYETTIILRRGAFGYVIATEGNYRVLTHVYAKKRQTEEELEGSCEEHGID